MSLLAKILRNGKKNQSIDFRGKKLSLFQTIIIDFYIDFSTNLRQKCK